MRKRILRSLIIILPIMMLSISEKSYGQARVNIDLFYSSLAPYGVWFEYRDYGLCWRPTVVGPGWRPYTHGHWVWTEYGWTWVSHYVWGWAPFHYGRWLYDDYYGWIWVPDDVWGPAWVEWRISDTYIGWAPLPPTARVNVGVGISVGSYSIPHFWWSFTTWDHFIGPRIVLLPVRRNVVILRETRSVDGVRYRDRRIYNEGPAVDLVERRVGGRVPRAAMVEDRSFGQKRGNRLEGDRLYVYRPEHARQNVGGSRVELRRERQQSGAMQGSYRDRFSRGEGEREQFERRRELLDSRRRESDVGDGERREREFRGDDRERRRSDREFSSESRVQRERSFRAEENNDWRQRRESRNEGISRSGSRERGERRPRER